MEVVKNYIMAPMARSWKSYYSRFMLLFVYLGLWLFAIIPMTNRPYLKGVCSWFWSVMILVDVFCVFYFYTSAENFSLAYLVTTCIFLTLWTCHLIIVLDSYAMRGQRSVLQQRFNSIQTCLSTQLKIPINTADIGWNSIKRLSLVLPVVVAGHIAVGWTIVKKQFVGTHFYWLMQSSNITIQIRTLEFFCVVETLNSYALLLANRMNTMGECNLHRIFQTAYKRQPEPFSLVSLVPEAVEAAEEQDLVHMKMVYSEIHALCKLINDTFGWSLLAITTMNFIDFVCNSYWIVVGIISSKDYDRFFFIQSVAYAATVLVMLSTLCWLSQQSCNHSHYIACIVFKLVKPLGNKRYNDLVTEFSLQTLHQQFIITAKNFFNLNLNLLGGMVAAVVTYLVILIQFMFSEQSTLNKELNKNLTMMHNATAVLVTTSTAITATTASINLTEKY